LVYTNTTKTYRTNIETQMKIMVRIGVRENNSIYIQVQFTKRQSDSLAIQFKWCVYGTLLYWY